MRKEIVLLQERHLGGVLFLLLQGRDQEKDDGLV